MTSQRQPHSGQRLFVRRKPAGVLRHHGYRIDRYGELAATTLDDLGVDPGSLLDERRHTGRTGTVISNLAVSNTDALHAIS